MNEDNMFLKQTTPGDTEVLLGGLKVNKTLVKQHSNYDFERMKIRIFQSSSCNDQYVFYDSYISQCS